LPPYLIAGEPAKRHPGGGPPDHPPRQLSDWLLIFDDVSDAELRGREVTTPGLV